MLSKTINDPNRVKQLTSLNIHSLEELRKILKTVDHSLLPLPGVSEFHRQKSIQLGILHDDYISDELGSLSHLISANRGQFENSVELPQMIKLSLKLGYYGLANVFIEKFLNQNHSSEVKAKLLIDTAEFHYKLSPKKLRAYISDSSKRIGVHYGATPQIIFQRQNRTAMFKYLLMALSIDFDMTYDAMRDPRRTLSRCLSDGTYEILFNKKPIVGKFPEKFDVAIKHQPYLKEAKKFLDLGKNYNAFVLLYEVVHNHEMDSQILNILIRCLRAMGQTRQANKIIGLFEKQKGVEHFSKLAS